MGQVLVLWGSSYVDVAEHCWHLQSVLQAEIIRHVADSGRPLPVPGVVVLLSGVVPGLAGFKRPLA
jgi:hypothetical protein